MGRTAVNKGICSRCRKRKTCKYTRPEGWVLECEEFEEDATAASGEQPVEEKLQEDSPEESGKNRKV
jgi:hypothetical protein